MAGSLPLSDGRDRIAIRRSRAHTGTPVIKEILVSEALARTLVAEGVAEYASDKPVAGSAIPIGEQERVDHGLTVRLTREWDGSAPDTVVSASVDMLRPLIESGSAVCVAPPKKRGMTFTFGQPDLRATAIGLLAATLEARERADAMLRGDALRWLDRSSERGPTDESGEGWKTAAVRWEILTGEAVTDSALRVRFNEAGIRLRSQSDGARTPRNYRISWCDADLRALATALGKPCK